MALPKMRLWQNNKVDRPGGCKPLARTSNQDRKRKISNMPKMKTHKGAKKRFHISGTGKVLRTKGPKSHFRRRKSARVKRLFGAKVALDSKKFSKTIKQAISAVR